MWNWLLRLTFTTERFLVRWAIVAVATVAIGSTTVAGGDAATAVRLATPAKVTVPDVVGLKSSAARRRLGKLGLHLSVRTVVSGRPVGTVVAERPAARAVVARGAVVRLSVSRGPAAAAAAQVSVPDLMGQLIDAAQQQVTNLGLVPNVLYEHSLELVGTVIAQNPPAGAQVAAGTQVTISISSGPGP